MGRAKRRAVLNMRVSTDGQTTDTQRISLEAVAEQLDGLVMDTYADAGISGAKCSG